MAKVFKAGTISVGGDQIRLTSKGTGKFAFTDSSNSDLFSTSIYDSEVSSLADHQNVDTLQRASDISSLDIVKDSEVSSLDVDVTQRSSDISSLDIVKDSEISSLNSALGDLDSALQVGTASIGDSISTQVLTWNELFGADSGFSSSTTVMVMIKAATGADLIAVQLAAVTNEGFTVDFSEDTGTSGDYDLVVMASN